MKREWWHSLTVYQIYTRSFCDSNGDGIGDFGGILQKLDYLQELGVGAIWLSPFNDSPNYDNGYDVSDYYKVMEEAGTMEELEELKTVGRREVAEKIKVALSFGDLSENSEYDEAKNEQAKLYGRIAEVENILSHAVVIDESAEQERAGVVGLGCTVKVRDLDLE